MKKEGAGYAGCAFFFSSRRRHTRWTGDWSSDVCSSDLETKRNATIDAGARVERLTPRQREVLALIASGLSSTMIAKRLGIAVSTVRKLTEQVYRQLGVSNRTQAAMHWVIAAPQSEPDRLPGSPRRAAFGR